MDAGAFHGKHCTGRAGGAALFPEFAGRLFGAARRGSALDARTPREREVLELMARGCTNRSVEERPAVPERAAEKHVAHIFAKLGPGPSGCGHRRVLAVLRCLEHGRREAPPGGPGAREHR